MARKPRLQFEGAIYHVMVRRNGRTRLFTDNRDHERWQESLASGVTEYGVRLYLQCQMANHAHLVCETPGANLAAFMGSVLTSYASYFNRRHHLRGHVFESRYKAILVEGDIYLLRLSRYLHTNPVRTRAALRQTVRKRLEALRQYRWSSYRGYAGYGRLESFIEGGPILAITPGKGRMTERYRRFVETELVNDDIEFLDECRGAGLALGSAAFRQHIERRYAREVGERVAREDIALRRQVDRADPKRILEAVCSYYDVSRDALIRRRRGNEARAVTAALLTRLGGLTQRQAAGLLGVTTGASVCQMLAALRARPTPAQTQALSMLTGRLT